MSESTVASDDDDPAVCRLQFPDGSVPSNSREAAEGWKRWADEFQRRAEKWEKLHDGRTQALNQLRTRYHRKGENMAYDDPPEPTEEEMVEYEASKLAATKEGRITIQGLTAQDVESFVRGIIDGRYGLTQVFEKEVKAAVGKMVSEYAGHTIEELCKPIIEEAIASGFPVFNSFTGKEESRTTIREMVDQILQGRVPRGRYEDGKGSMPEVVITKTIKEMFDGEMKTVIEHLRVEFKKQADEVFKAKMVQVLRDAIGVR